MAATCFASFVANAVFRLSRLEERAPQGNESEDDQCDDAKDAKKKC